MKLSNKKFKTVLDTMTVESGIEKAAKVAQVSRETVWRFCKEFPLWGHVLEKNKQAKKRLNKSARASRKAVQKRLP